MKKKSMTLLLAGALLTTALTGRGTAGTDASGGNTATENPGKDSRRRRKCIFRQQSL